MRVCPKCGYMDPLIWRTNRWRPNVDFTRIDLFEEHIPELARKLREGYPVVTDVHYAYRLGAKGKFIVERVYIEEYKGYGRKAFHMPFEHANHYKDPYQKKLEVAAET